MEENLIQRLRTCETNEKRDLAFRLASLRTDRAVAELKTMVECGTRLTQPYTRKISFFGIPLFSFQSSLDIHYTHEDQYTGLEALGETNREDVLFYLRNIYTPNVYTEPRESHCVQGIDCINDNWKIEIHSYPNAPQSLANELSYAISLTTSNWGCEQEVPLEEIERNRIETPANMRAHQIIRAAIKRLESTIK